MNDTQLTADERRRIRARELLDRWLLIAVVLLIVLISLGGWLAYEPLAGSATEEREEVVGNFSEEGHFTHQAEIQRSNRVYDEGMVVRNRPIYYTQISPVIEGTYEYAYRANEGSVDVVSNAYLRLQSVDDEGNEHWSKTEPLERSEVEDVSPGEEVPVSFSVNVTEAVNEMEAIESELGASPGDTRAKVVVETEATGVVAGEDVANRHTAELVLAADSGTYSVETATSGQAQREFVETVETEREYGPVRAYGPLGLTALGFVGLSGLGIQRFRGKIAPTEAELAVLTAARQREEFDDWISAGRFPEDEMAGPRVDVGSLEDLVDVAIDCDSRVIEDERGYYVSDGELYYAYRPGGSSVGGTDGPSGGTGEIATFDGDSDGASVDSATEAIDESHGAGGSGAGVEMSSASSSQRAPSESVE